jgi:epoxide hydrolase
VTMALANEDEERISGIHLTVVLADPEQLEAFGELTEQEQGDLARLDAFHRDEFGYGLLQRSRPQTLGYALADSPAGQCTWIVEKFHEWMDCDGHPENAVSRDELLDNVMVYWLGNAATSSARLYWESAEAAEHAYPQIRTPAAYTVFPKEIFLASERWARTRCEDLRYYKRAERGGHFAAFEQPEAFVVETRAAFRAIFAQAASTNQET